MDRYWFFTWRTYGTWLPGDDGFVGHYTSTDGRRVIDNQPGEVRSEALPPLERFAHEAMTGEPVLLPEPLAHCLVVQFHETARVRGWVIDAIAVLATHAHLVFGVTGDPEPSDMLRDWKSYASRALNRSGVRPPSPRWWADGGSKRRLVGEEGRMAAIQYVRDQLNPLVVWLSDEALRLVRPIATGGPCPGEPAA